MNLSPEYTDEEVRQVWKAGDLSDESLLSPILTTDLPQVKRLKTPLLLFLGRHDYNVSATVAAEWFASVKAPSKQLVWFEQSAHELMAAVVSGGCGPRARRWNQPGLETTGVEGARPRSTASRRAMVCA